MARAWPHAVLHLEASLSCPENQKPPQKRCCNHEPMGWVLNIPWETPLPSIPGDGYGTAFSSDGSHHSSSLMMMGLSEMSRAMGTSGWLSSPFPSSSFCSSSDGWLV